ncbi:MAG TPA: hypothetical protein VK960_05525 [Acidimicrobiia bacterium]|nr:hypothetical protein [Acidimicrobiia bacterium]
MFPKKVTRRFADAVRSITDQSNGDAVRAWFRLGAPGGAPSPKASPT